jgi:hypothetical protein
MRLRRWLTGLSVGSLVLMGTIAAGPVVGSAQEAQRNAAPVVGAPLLEPAIDLARAQEVALEGQTGAVVTDIELTGEEGLLAYTVALDNGVEVEIDATSGEILKTEQEDENGEGSESEDENGDEDEEGAEDEEGDETEED